MPDWQQLVRDRLALLDLNTAERDEVCTELAAHLEDSCEALRSTGVTGSQAVQSTLCQVTDWEDLRCQIATAKNGGPSMTERLRQLWIPGLLTLTLTILCDFALHKLGFHPRSVPWSHTHTFLFYVPWLLSLPLLGALGAFISVRAGGSRATVFVASTFPALSLSLAFLLMFPIGIVVEWVTGTDLDFRFLATLLLRDGIGWLLLPFAALFAGGLLVQLVFRRKQPSPATAVG
jgi:hypothetical protein